MPKRDDIVVAPGDFFNLTLADGTVLNVEQTADDFLVHAEGRVAYTAPTSAFAKDIYAEMPSCTGRK